MPIPSLNCAGSGASNVLEKKIIKKITVFPNPTSGKITIQFDAKFSFSFQIEIYSINGQKVFSTILQDSFNKIDLSKLEKGMYFIRLTKENEIITKKIIIS